MKTWRVLLFSLLALAIIGSIGAAIRMRMNLLFGVPIALALGLQVVYNYKPVFFFLIFCIPFSMQINLTESFAMDVFTEPLMLVFLAIFLLNLFSGKQFSRNRKIYPFHILIFLILFWTMFTTLNSEFIGRSFKFFLAKLWYLATFVYMADRIIQTPKDVKYMFWAFFSSMMLVVIGITIRHALTGFSYGESNGIAFPLYANGVIYSATLVLFLPWVWFARSWYTPKSLEWYILNIGMGILLIGIFFSYKRGAYVTTLMLPVMWLLINRKVLDKLIYAGLIFVVLGVSWLVNNNNFYIFAPNYQSTVWHGDDFTAHLEATFQGTEISGIERFYRWVAAKNMVADMPFVGSGPSTFNQVYKRYADDAFRTYVSDNPEQSTTHNYFLMTFAEQGFPGGLLFAGLVFLMVLKGIYLAYQVEDPTRKSIVFLALFSLATILIHSLLNEMIEVDKIGSMFWLCLVVIHKSDIWHERAQKIRIS
ncbi:MAG: O-antigen ligase family protein [Bacteroidota bacterium]